MYRTILFMVYYHCNIIVNTCVSKCVCVHLRLLSGWRSAFLPAHVLLRSPCGGSCSGGGPGWFCAPQLPAATVHHHREHSQESGEEVLASNGWRKVWGWS